MHHNESPKQMTFGHFKYSQSQNLMGSLSKQQPQS